MAAIMISVGDINFENLSCNNRGVHIWAKQRAAHQSETIGFLMSTHPTALTIYFASIRMM